MIEHFLNPRHLIQISVARISHHQTRNIVITLEILGLLFDTLGNEIIHAALNITRRILLQTRHNQILLINDTPVVKPLLTVQDLHQRRFTCAVTANQADAFVIFDMQFCIIKKRRIAERQPCTMHTDQ